MRTIYTQGGNKYSEFSGNHSETKPTDVGAGSIFVENDTGNVFFYDEVENDWIFQFSFQSEE